MVHRKIGILSAISLAIFSLSASSVWSQIEIGNSTLSGEAEVGALPRSFSGSRNKFLEYRDVPETVIVPGLELRLDSNKNDYYLEFDAGKVGRDDQNYRLRWGRYGWIDLEFEWDQIPHTFNVETAATPYRMDDGRFTLASKPGASGTGVRDWVNSVAERTNLNLYNGLAKFKLRYTPNPGWTFTGNYGLQKTQGSRAFATTTNRFSNIVELAEPIDYQTHNIELGGEYAASWWTLGLKYNASLFHNSNSTLVWDNPFNISGVGSACTDTAAAPAGSFGAGGTCRGRLDLYPSNQAHTFSLTGTANLPFKTNLLGTVSYGWRLQDDSFLPFTSNTAIAQPLLPRNSLDGDVRPTMVNLTLVNRYIDRLNLKASYRYYDFDNRTKKLLLEQGYVVTDTGAPTGTAIRSFPWSYSKQNLGLESGYQFTKWLNGKLSYGWERMHRESREVLTADEHSIGPAFDIQPTSWVLFRASYKRFWRNAPDYDAGRYNVVLIEETPDDVRKESLEALRKVDEAARTRDKVSFFAQVSPFETLTLHGGFDVINDNYSKTVVGLKNDVNYSPSVGFVYAPLDWAHFFGDYNWDRFNWKLRAMERSAQNVAGCPGRDDQTPENCPSSLWTSRGKETVHTFSLGMDTKLIKDVLGFRVQYGYSQGRSDVSASGNTTPGNVPATDYPTISNRWHELLARLEYTVHKHVALQLGYYFNSYHSKDSGVDIMKLWMGDVDSGANNSIWLGDRLKGSYRAHVGFLAMKFKF